MDHFVVSGMFCAYTRQSTLGCGEEEKPQSNLFCGSIEFPRQPRDDGGTSVSTNIPCALLLQPSGEGFLFTFFFGLLKYKIKSFGSKFQLSVLCPFKQICTLCRICAAFTPNATGHAASCKDFH